jgi:hypothetical protein
MFSLKSTILAFLTVFAVARSQQFQIQNWGNGEDTTNYTYKSLAAGRFTLDWVLGPGGNFVAGKGYKGSQNLFVIHLMSIDYRLTSQQRSQLHSKLQPNRQLIPRPVRLLKQPPSRVLRHGLLRRAQPLRQRRPLLLRLPHQ